MSEGEGHNNAEGKGRFSGGFRLIAVFGIGFLLGVISIAALYGRDFSSPNSLRASVLDANIVQGTPLVVETESKGKILRQKIQDTGYVKPTAPKKAKNATKAKSSKDKNSTAEVKVSKTKTPKPTQPTPKPTIKPCTLLTGCPDIKFPNGTIAKKGEDGDVVPGEREPLRETKKWVEPKDAPADTLVGFVADKDSNTALKGNSDSTKKTSDSKSTKSTTTTTTSSSGSSSSTSSGSTPTPSVVVVAEKASKKSQPTKA